MSRIPKVEESKYNKAIDFYKKAETINPKNAILLNNLAKTFVCINQVNEAEKFCRKAISIDKINDEFKKTLSLILLKKRYGSKAPILTRIKQERQDAARFHSILLDVTASLDSLYNLELPKDEILTMRETIFRNAQLRYKSLRPQFLVSNYDYFLKWKVNNAQLMSYRRYNRDLDLFSSVYDNNNRRLDLVIEHCQACSNSSDPWQCLRTLSSN